MEAHLPESVTHTPSSVVANPSLSLSLCVFFKNGIVVWFQGIVLLSTPRSKSFPCWLFVYHKESLRVRRNWIRFRRGCLLLRPTVYDTQTDHKEIIHAHFVKTDKTEINFIFVCPKYKTLRETYLLETFYLHPPALKIAILLADTKQTTPLAILISEAFKLRSSVVLWSLNTLDVIS